MLPDRVSSPGPLTYESSALQIALRGPAVSAFSRSCLIGKLWSKLDQLQETVVLPIYPARANIPKSLLNGHPATTHMPQRKNISAAFYPPPKAKGIGFSMSFLPSVRLFVRQLGAISLDWFKIYIIIFN